MSWVAVAAALAFMFLARGRSPRREKGIDRLRRLHGDKVDDTVRSGSRPGKRPVGVLLELPYMKAPKRLKRYLSADLKDPARLSGIAIEQLAGARIWASITMTAAVLLLGRFSPVAIAGAPPIAAAGYMLPGILASRRRARHLEQARGCLAHTADMLYTLLLGGKNLDQAFRGAAEASPEPLGSLLLQTVHEIDLGASREEAFARLLERCPLPELFSLLALLEEAERRGYALSGTLEVFSREIRLRRRDQLRVAVAKAPLKMLAPLVLLILPASVLLTVGPTFLVTLKKVF